MNDGTEPVAPDASEPVEPVTADTGEDTVQAAADTPDFNRLVEDLEKNWDKVPQDLRARLDKNFQPAFNKKLNLLNQNVEAAIRNTGVQIPEGKTPLDLLTENEGKDFGAYIRGEMAKEFGPIKDKISQAEQQNVLTSAMQRAARDNPEIQPFMEASIREIDGDADLTQLAMTGNGNGIYYVLQGVAALKASQQKDQKIKALESLLDKNKIAYKTAGGTTRAGTQTPKAQQPKAPKTLKEAARQAMELIKAEAEA